MLDFGLLPPTAKAMKAIRDLFSTRFLLLFWCFCCYFQDLSAIGSQRLHPDEIAILKKIDSKFKIGWDFSVNPCSGKNGWQQGDTPDINNIQRNVTCDCDMNDTCHVISIQLKTQNLTGNLPVEFANLTSLVVIDLTRNNINGSIPLEWGSLPLTNISLGNNRISGKIPDEIGNISTLKSLVLENNLLHGSIPSSLGRLKNLERLILSANDFIGQLPESLGNLTNLIDFRIDGSGISGEIPSFIGNWTNLLRLHLQGTSLEGTFPAEISTLKSLVQLLVSDLKGVGTFPRLQNMNNLNELILRNCSISDKLPLYIGEMTNLTILDLSFNNFTGKIPNTYRKLANRIQYLYLTNNMLSGRIPDWIYNSIKVIDVSYNFFEESSARSNCDQQGTRVNAFASSSSPENRLVDPCLRNTCSSITNYNIFINCGGDAANYEGEQYDEDKEQIGASKFHLASSKRWGFSSTGDFFFHTLSRYIATNHTMLNISDPKIYMTARLSPSSLNYYGICLYNGNYTVKLHFAEIMFMDGHTFYSVGRPFFDVLIQGQKVLEDFNIAAEANGTGREIKKSFNARVYDNTLVISFRWSGKGTNSVPEKGVYGPLISAISITANFKPDMGTHGLALGAIIGIVIGSIAGILLILLVLYFLLRRKYHVDNGLGGVNLQISQFSLRQIRSATRNFNHANKIGEGGFGPVFKGVLLDGTPIAVKQLSSKSRQGNREFITEIGMISALQHPNLVKLLGCCIEGNQLLLVYEYMENNSLYHILFGPDDKRLKLDWKTRQNICLGIARGLAYLHEESRIKIVHRDIKATNVLLDKDLNAKISDFGLAKLDDEQNTHMSTRIAGTRGYMAPEYALRGHLTHKADVYSFGIVLLEVISGKSNIICMPDLENTYLLDWAYNLEENGKLLQLVDEKLGSNYSEEEAIQMMKLALFCANSSPSVRPEMSKVVSTLESKKPIHILSLTQGISKSEELKVKAFQEFPLGNALHGGWNLSTVNTATSSSQISMNRLMTHYDEDMPR